MSEVLVASSGRANFRSLMHIFSILRGSTALLFMFGLAACTGSPETLAHGPAFEVRTSAGIAGVSIRESLPGMPDREFAELVRTGMDRALSGNVLQQDGGTPFPLRRIVWHVTPVAARGESRLMVNVFDGSVPVACQQVLVADSTPRAMITYKVELMSRRLIALYARQVADAPA